MSFAPFRFNSKFTLLTTLSTYNFFFELTTSASKSKWPTAGTFNCWLPLMPCGSQQLDWISVGSTKDLRWSEWKGGAVDVFSRTIQITILGTWFIYDVYKHVQSLSNVCMCWWRFTIKLSFDTCIASTYKYSSRAKNDYIWYRYSYKSPKIWPYKKASPSFKASLQQEKQHHWRTNTRRRVHRDCTSCSCPVASHRWPLTASRRWLSVAGEDWEMLVHIGPI